jgi:hypothetical protein
MFVYFISIFIYSAQHEHGINFCNVCRSAIGNTFHYLYICKNTNVGIQRFGLVWFIPFNATFNNISIISWQSVLLVVETGVPGENHRPGYSAE